MEDLEFKLEVYIPEENLDELIAELQKVGAGHNGNYDSCMSISDVESLWRRLPGSLDLMGSEVGEVVRKKEKKLEFKIEKHLFSQVYNAILKVHPYENPVINIVKILG